MLLDGNVLEQREVHILQPRSGERIAAKVPQRSGRRKSKARWVDVLVRVARVRRRLASRAVYKIGALAELHTRLARLRAGPIGGQNDGEGNAGRGGINASKLPST